MATNNKPALIGDTKAQDSVFAVNLLSLQLNGIVQNHLFSLGGLDIVAGNVLDIGFIPVKSPIGVHDTSVTWVCDLGNDSCEGPKMRGLIILEEPLNKILAGTKTWEIRGSRTLIREQIALLQSGSGTSVGVCDLVDCLGPISPGDLRKNSRKTGITRTTTGSSYKQTFAWVLKNARRLAKPVPYDYPAGAIIWVRLNDEVAKQITRQGWQGWQG